MNSTIIAGNIGGDEVFGADKALSTPGIPLAPGESLDLSFDVLQAQKRHNALKKLLKVQLKTFDRN